MSGSRRYPGGLRIVDGDGPVMNQSSPGERRWFSIPLWGWVIAAIGSAALLAVAILGWGDGRGATLRAMTASESMSDAQARAVADNTMRAWLRERAALQSANLEALSCPNPAPNSMLTRQLDAARKRVPTAKNSDVVATGMFVRKGPVWTIDVFFGGPWVEFEFHVVNGELRVCNMGGIPPQPS
jgi:hypothetical protein